MEKRKELENEITIEIENLERLNQEMKHLLASIEEEKSSMEVRAAGSILHDFYCGIEKIFERIAVVGDRNLPHGEDWHKDLLFQMAKSFEETRGKVISEDLLQPLKEYLRFRHLFRHIYGFELKWNRIKPLCMEMETLLDNLKSELERFLETLDKA